jgi:hypothetical protein
MSATFTEVRSHDVIKRRTSKGATTGRVVRFGKAQVSTGSTVSTDGDASPFGQGRMAAFMLELEHLPRGTFGYNAIALAKLTDRLCEGYDLPVLLGTEVRGFQQMTPEAGCVAMDYNTVEGRTWLSDGASTELDRLAAPASVYGVQTRYNVTTTNYPTRRRLTFRARTAERAAVIGERSLHQPTVSDVPDWRTWKVIAVPASADRPDAYWRGHQLTPRVPARKNGNKRGARIARTVVSQAPLPTDHEAFEIALRQLAPGHRATYNHDGHAITITRAPSRKLTAMVDGERVAKSARTELAIVRKVFSAI